MSKKIIFSIVSVREKIDIFIKENKLNKEKRCGIFASIINKIIKSTFGEPQTLKKFEIQLVSPFWTIKEAIDYLDDKIIPAMSCFCNDVNLLQNKNGKWIIKEKNEE